MRSLWNGSIGFGLVNIPVRLYTAVEDSKVTLVQLDKKTQSRVQYKKVSESSGKELKSEDIIKAYPVGGGYITLEDEDFQKAIPIKKDHIDIVQFVNEKEIDAQYFEKPYYLEPQKGGERAYALLRDALRKEGKGALGLFVFHNREWVCLLKPSGKAIILNRLRFSEELRSTDGLKLPETTAKAGELKMAAMLIGQLTKPFKPDQFRDEYSAKLLQVIEAKSQGKKAVFKPMKVVHSTNTEDLMAKLKASLKTKKAS